MLLTNTMAAGIVALASVGAATPLAKQSSNGFNATQMDDFKKEMIMGHTWYRKQHSASEVIWSDEVAAAAQDWANQCTMSHKVRYTNSPNQGNELTDVTCSLTTSTARTSPGAVSRTGRIPKTCGGASEQSTTGQTRALAAQRAISHRWSGRSRLILAAASRSAAAPTRTLSASTILEAT